MAGGRWRRFVLRPIVWLVALAALAVLGLKLFLASDFARVRARDLLAARLGDALAREVSIERVDFSLLPLVLEVEGLTIAGDRPGAAPWVTLRRGEVAAELGSLGERRLALRRVGLSGLVMALEFRRDGSDNLPRPGRAGGQGLAVSIDGLTIDDSRLLLDHQVVPLELTASAVAARLVGVSERGLDGAVTAQEVELVLPGARPLALAVSGRARLDDGRVVMSRARVDGRGLLVTAEGEVGLRRQDGVRLTTSVTTRGELLDELGWLHGELSGPLSFAGDVVWRPGDWSVDGRLDSPRLAVVDFVLEELAGAVRVDRDGGEVAIERARWAGGDLGGRFGVRFATGYPAVVDVALAGAELDAALTRFAVPVAGARGRLSGPFRYDFDLLAATRGEGRGELVIGVEELGATRLHAEGELGLVLSGGRVTIDPLRWRAAGQRVGGRGEIELGSGTGRLDLAVASEDLGALAGLLPFLDREALWVPRSGTGELAVGIDLLPEGAFAVELDVAAAALEAPGVVAQRVTGEVRVSAEVATIDRLELVRGASRLLLAGRVPFAADEPVDLDLEIHDWPFADAAPWLPTEMPVDGVARGTVTLRGSAAAPAGTADLVLAPAEVAGVPARRLAACLDWNEERLRLTAGRADFDAGGVAAEGTLRFADEAIDFSIVSPSLAFDREPFAPLGRGALDGSLRLEAELGGTLGAPRLDLRGTASDVTLVGRALGAEGAATMTIRWAEGRLTADVDLGGEVRLAGGGPFVVDGDSRLDFDWSSGRIDRLVALATGTHVDGLEGGVSGTVAVDWPAGGAPRAVVTVPRLDLTWRGQALRSLEPIAATIDESGFAVDSAYLGAGDDDDLFIGGRVEFGADPRLDLHLQASAGADWLAGLVGELGVTGRFDVLADLGGTISQPEWSGQAGWTRGRIVPPVLPHAVERASALVLLYPGSLVLDRLSGDFAGGTVNASGRLQIAGGAPGTYRFELAGRDLALRWPSGWQLNGDADLSLVSTRGGRQLGGQVEIERAFYFQDIELSPTELVQRLLARSPVVVPETDELLASTVLDVAVRAPGTIRVRNNVASLGAAAELAVRGSLARPAVFGDVVSSVGSEVEYGGSTYRLERGVLTFANPTRIDPLLDVVATTRVQEYDVRLQLSGPLSRPVTAFSSDPPLPDLEILGLLSTGAPLEAAVLTDVRPSAEGSASVAAEALLYGQAASLVGARVGKLFGFDRIRVEPLTARDSVSAARVTVGKRLSSRVFVTYSYDPSSTAQDIIQVEWRLTDQLQLVLTQNGDESYAVDARWERRF